MENDTRYRSDDIGLLMGSLSKAQGSYKKLVANEEAVGGARFANLQAILAAVRESLSSNGLGFYQYIELLDEGSGVTLLKTVLGHESGQFLVSCARIMGGGKTERSLGNLVEIHKRLHALMILGIAPSEGDPYAFDDNGQELAEEKLIKEVRMPKEQEEKRTSLDKDRTDCINKDQYTELMIELEGFEPVLKDMLETYKIESLADLPRSEYHIAMARIRKIKKTEEEYRRRNK